MHDRTLNSISQDHGAVHPQPHLVSSSDSEFLSIQQLIATRHIIEPDSDQVLTSRNVQHSLDRSSSSVLSTIPDSPEINYQPTISLPDPI